MPLQQPAVTPWYPREDAPSYVRYGASVLVTAVALGLTLWLQPVLVHARFVLFYAAVTLSAWYGGLGPGLVAGILAVVAADYYLIPPTRSFQFADPQDVVPLGVFAAAAYLISSITEALRTERQRALEAVAEATRLAAQFQDQEADVEQQAAETQALTEELEETNEQLRETTAEAEEARDAAEQVRERLQSVLDSLPDATSAFDRDWRWTYINPAASRELGALGMDPAEMIGRVVWDEIPGLAGTRFRSEAARAVEEQQVVSFEEYFAPRDQWLETTVVPMADGVVTYARDVTERRREAEAKGFLADAGAALNTSLEYHATLDVLARLTIGRLADGCAIHLARGGELIELAAVASRDPEKARVVEELDRRFPLPADAPLGHAHVIRTGQPELLAAVDDEALRAITRDLEQLALIRRLDMYSGIIVPLAARGRTFGAITLVRHGPGRRAPYGPAELALGQELARHAALAIDNALAYEQAESARAQAEAANRAKSEWMATMSHELRTPLNAILGYTELLSLGVSGSLSEQQRAQLERVRASTDHVLCLVNEVLDLAKIESGGLALERERGVVRDAVEAAVSLTRPQAEAKGLTLSVAGDGHGALYEGDAQRVQQILTNLLSNAVKFTDSGGRVTVRWESGPGVCPPASAEVTGGAEGWVGLLVADTGVGIAPANLERIFDPFVQAESSYSRAPAGTGLGLTISRRLARMMGGDVTVRSDVGAGSVFTLWLPGAQESR